MNPPCNGESDLALQIPPPKLGDVPRLLAVETVVRSVIFDSLRPGALVPVVPDVTMLSFLPEPVPVPPPTLSASRPLVKVKSGSSSISPILALSFDRCRTESRALPETVSTWIGHRWTRRRKPLMIPKVTNRRTSIPLERTSLVSIHSCTVIPGLS